MSNFLYGSTPSRKKVIRIKQADFFKREEQVPTLSEEQIHKQMEEKILLAKHELENIKSKQTALLQQTKLQIEQEKQQWAEEKTKWINEAKEEGYTHGYAEGKEESLKEYEHLLVKANEIVERATKDYYATIEKYEDTIVQLAMQVSERVVKQELTETPTRFVPIVKAAIKELKEQPIIKIYVHSNHYQAVLDAKQELQQLLEEGAKLSIYVKDELDEFGCEIDHPLGKLDVSVDTQLTQIRSALEQIAQGNKE